MPIAADRLVGHPTLRRLALDAVTVEVVREFRRYGIAAILLKGRSIAERLYPDETARPYRDVDLLVRPRERQRAGRLLANLGFVELMAGARDRERCPHADTWVRPATGAIVDLHVSLFGAGADPAVVWSTLCEHQATLTIGAQTVSILDDAGLALHIAMHAAQHGIASPQPMADLNAALATFDPTTMDTAAALAVRLDAMPAFVAGLRLVPGGQSLARVWGAGVAIPTATAVRAVHGGRAGRGAGSVAQVLDASGWRRVPVVVGRTFPSRAAIRRSMPLARRGRIGLVAAYALRPLWLAISLPAAVRARRAALRTWRQDDAVLYPPAGAPAVEMATGAAVEATSWMAPDRASSVRG